MRLVHFKLTCPTVIVIPGFVAVNALNIFSSKVSGNSICNALINQS